MLARTLVTLALAIAIVAGATPAAADPLDPPGPLDPLMPPVDLQATYDDAAGAVTLTWSPAPGDGDVQAYAVYRDGLALGTTSGLGFVDAAPGTGGVYTVTALALARESLPSGPAVVAIAPPLAGLVRAPHIGLDAVVLGVRTCEPIIVAGLPPSAHVNWDCIDLPPSLEA